MLKAILVIIGSVIATQSFAANLDFKVCDGKRGSYQVKISDSQIVIHKISDKTEDDIVLTPKSEETIKSGDFGDEEQIILSFLGLDSFIDGVSITGTDAKDNTIYVTVFNYKKNQKMLALFVEGWPVPMGKTENCR